MTMIIKKKIIDCLCNFKIRTIHVINGSYQKKKKKLEWFHRLPRGTILLIRTFPEWGPVRVGSTSHGGAQVESKKCLRLERYFWRTAKAVTSRDVTQGCSACRSRQKVARKRQGYPPKRVQVPCAALVRSSHFSLYFPQYPSPFYPSQNAPRPQDSRVPVSPKTSCVRPAHSYITCIVLLLSYLILYFRLHHLK